MSEISTGEIALSPASLTDLSAIEELLRSNDLPVAGIKQMLDCFVVAERDGRVVGVAGVEQCGAYGLLRSVAVDQSERGRGIGRALVEWLIADSEANGLRALYLLTTTAENYFPTFGFVTTSRDSVPAEVQKTKEFKEICPSSATVMRRSLGGT